MRPPAASPRLPNDWVCRSQGPSWRHCRKNLHRWQWRRHPPRQSLRRFPPFAHDGTERRIVRPQDAAEQTECYSGKKKDHTVKNVLLVNAPLTVLFLSDTVGGRVHDKRIADATPYPLPAGSRLLQDLGFVAFTLPDVEILMPMQKPRGQVLTPEQQRINQSLHERRLRI